MWGCPGGAATATLRCPPGSLVCCRGVAPPVGRAGVSSGTLPAACCRPARHGVWGAGPARPPFACCVCLHPVLLWLMCSPAPHLPLPPATCHLPPATCHLPLPSTSPNPVCCLSNLPHPVPQLCPSQRLCVGARNRERQGGAAAQRGGARERGTSRGRVHIRRQGCCAGGGRGPAACSTSRRGGGGGGYAAGRTADEPAAHSQLSEPTLVPSTGIVCTPSYLSPPNPLALNSAPHAFRSPYTTFRHSGEVCLILSCRPAGCAWLAAHCASRLGTRALATCVGLNGCIRCTG